MANIKIITDLRGAVSLTIDGITGIIDLTEDLHHTIASIAVIFGAPKLHRTTGLTGLIYRNIRAVCRLVGKSIDAILENIVSLTGEKNPDTGRGGMLAALNGVLGDHLAASNNPLAIPMQLRRNGAPLAMDDLAFSRAVLGTGGKLALMVHGSCRNDLQWNRRGHDHGEALARDLGYMPIYLHYNTGRHISENGRSFSELMETFITKLPRPVELVIIAHSMGGLVSRSACHYGKLAGHAWLAYLHKLIFLGTPHHGAALERGGNWIDVLLKISPYTAPFSRLGRIRSHGVTDLRYGNLLDDDWKGRDRFKNSGDRRVVVPLPDGVQCYAMAVTMVKKSSKFGDRMIGDGLVALNSALGLHENTDLNLLFPENHQWVGRDMNHFDLLSQPEVYETIMKWLTD